VFGENLLYQAGRNLGTLLIGRSLGPLAVGTFALATNVILMPFSRIAGPLQQVFFPAFSRMNQDRERIADVWIGATRLVAMLAMPALVGLVIVAPQFVEVVLGQRWVKADAAIVIQILAIAGLLQALGTLNGEVLFSLNKAGTLLRFTAVWFVATVAAFVVGRQWGVEGVAVSYALVAILLEPLRAYITTHALQISFWRFVRSFGGVAQGTAVMVAALLPTRAALETAGLPAAVELVVLVLLGLCAYIGGCLWRAPELKLEIRRAVGLPRPSAD
jgi:O-antigen/teichoic acid export membrane protein